MYSFYGGKQGRTYHIVERYDSIYLDPTAYADFDSNKESYNQGEYFKYNEKFYKVLVEGSISDIDAALDDYKIVQIKGMVNCFSLGGSYTDVNYGEYVIIDTFLNEHHRNDEVNGLLYRRGLEYNQVGTTTRPIRQQYDSQEAYNAVWYNYILHPGAGAVYIGQILGPQGLSPQLEGIKWSDGNFDQNNSTILDTTLGYDGTEFHDDIKLGWINIKDADGDTYQCRLAFDIPTPVINIQGKAVSAYGSPVGRIITKHKSIAFPDDEDDDIQTIDITIPDPLNPNAVNYQGLVHLHSKTGVNAGHPFFYDYQIAIPNGKHGADFEDVSVTTIQGQQYLRVRKRSYESSEEGEVVDFLNIPYKIIDNIITTQKGRGGITWPSSFPINCQRGQIINSAFDYNKVFICVKPGSLNMLQPREESSPVVSAFSSDENQIVTDLTLGTIFKGYYPGSAVTGASEWLYTSLPVNGVVDSIDIDYTYGEDDSFALRQIEYIFLGTDDILYVKYTDKPDLVPAGQLDTIRNVVLTDDGQIQIETGSQKIYSIGTLNYVKQVAIHGDCIIAYYSNSGYRQNIRNSTTQNIDWFDIDGETWVNLGAITSGNHIIGDYSYQELLSLPPFEGNQAGWIATVTTGDRVIQYAYDYNKTHNWTRADGIQVENSHWYPIGSVQTNPEKTMIIDSANNQGNSPATKDTTLSAEGFWFVKTSGHHDGV